MEADKFDRLMAEKLGQADVPEFSESKWASLSSQLPSSGFAVSWTNLSLVLLLVLSNAWWIWNSTGGESLDTTADPSVSPAPKAMMPNEVDPVIEEQIVIVYDTVYKVVEIERIVYANPETEYIAEDARKNVAEYPNSTDHLTKDETQTPSDAINETVLMGMEDEMLITDPDHNGLIPDEDSLAMKEDKAQESVATEEPAIKNEKQVIPYAGPRWFIGINAQKPFSIVGSQQDFSGNSFGINIEYIPTSWFSLIGEVNFFNYDYSITDEAFYEMVRESGDPDIYGPGGVYGSGYSWQQSDVSRNSTQAGLIIKLSTPTPKTKVYPFVSSGYMIDLSTRTDVSNRLIESGTSKAIRVESFLPNDKPNHYIRSEIGLESQLNNQFWLRISGDYWIQTSGSPYEGDLIGGKVVILYKLK